MGNDGGSIPKRIDLVKTKKEHVIKQKRRILQERFKSCAFTNEPLKPPIVVCRKGFLFNKESLLEALIAKNLPEQLQYISRMRDFKEVTINANTNPRSKFPIVCPLTGKEVNGLMHFVCNWRCGCLLNEKMLLSLAHVNFSLEDIHVMKRNKADKEAAGKVRKREYRCPNCLEKFALRNLRRLNTSVEIENPSTADAKVEKLKMKLKNAGLGKRSHLEAIGEEKAEEGTEKTKGETKKTKANTQEFGLPRPDAFVAEAFHKKGGPDERPMHRDTRHGIR